MVNLNTLVPMIMHIISALFTFIISYFSFKAYNISKEKKYFWFGTSFTLITMSFVLFFITHSFNLYRVAFQDILPGSFTYYGHLLYTTSYVSGLLMLSFVYGKIKDFRTTGFIGIIILFLMFLLHTNFIEFAFLVMIIGTYLISKSYQAYISSKNKDNKLITISFFILTLGYGLFVLFHSILNVMTFLPYLIESIAYLIIAYVIIKALREN